MSRSLKGGKKPCNCVRRKGKKRDHPAALMVQCRIEGEGNRRRGYGGARLALKGPTGPAKSVEFLQKVVGSW